MLLKIGLRLQNKIAISSDTSSNKKINKSGVKPNNYFKIPVTI